MRLPKADLRVVDVLRALPGVPAGALPDVAELLRRAEMHGVAGLVHDALVRANASGCAAIESEFAWRGAAREIDHAAHLRMLARIDESLSARGLVAVALKGPLLGERLYPRPSTRATSDIDLLVDEDKLDAAAAALAEVGYVGAAGPEEDRYRRHHHHLHFRHDHALPLELHFHAYRGFGRLLPSEPLVARSRVYDEGGFRALSILAPEDELVFLAVHAAAHRFVRLGWLFDLRLLLDTLSYEQRTRAARRATEWGYARTLAFTAQLLVDVFGVKPGIVQPLVRHEPWRLRVVNVMAAEPAGALSRSASRFLYSLALCDSPTAALHYSKSAALGYAARVTGAPP